MIFTSDEVTSENLPNRLTSDKKIVIHGNVYYFISYTLFYVMNTQIR